MDNPTEQKQNASKDKTRFDGVLSLIFKQTLTSAVFLLVLVGMKNGTNQFLKNCAASISEALRYDVNWEEGTREIIRQIKPYRDSSEGNSSPEPNVTDTSDILNDTDNKSSFDIKDIHGATFR